jgi:hypothetical protein
MLRWWRARRRQEESLEAHAERWLARHGRHARGLASLRSIDAYLIGDLSEQERWGRIRELIEEQQEEEEALARRQERDSSLSGPE